MDCPFNEKDGVRFQNIACVGVLEKYCWTLSLEAFLPFFAAEGFEVSHEQILALRVGYRVTSCQFPHCKAAAVVDSIIYTRVMIWCSVTNIERRFPSSI